MRARTAAGPLAPAACQCAKSRFTQAQAFNPGSFTTGVARTVISWNDWG
jgi:hypothetical protein